MKPPSLADEKQVLADRVAGAPISDPARFAASEHLRAGSETGAPVRSRTVHRLTTTMKNWIRSLTFAVLSLAFTTCVVAATPPKVGDKAPDFMLQTLEDKAVKLSELTAKGKVVLVVLRGWPGYQCPLCTRQVRDFTGAAADFAKAGARVLMVYPGPSGQLKLKAQEFLGNAEWPKEFIFVTDPDFTMVNAYGLRWDAKSETAYPSTFVLDRKGMVQFAKISKSHGDRAQAAEVVKAAATIPAE